MKTIISGTRRVSWGCVLALSLAVSICAQQSPPPLPPSEGPLKNLTPEEIARLQELAKQRTEAAAKAKQERLARDYEPWIHAGPLLDGKALASPKDWVNAVPEISATKTNVAVLVPYSPDNQQRFYRLVELP